MRSTPRSTAPRTFSRDGAPKRKAGRQSIKASNRALGVGTLVEHRFDVDDRRAVERFDRSNPQAVSLNLAHLDAMEAQRIGAVRGAGGEDAGKRSVRIAARMHLGHVAIGAVQPGDHDDVVAGRNPQEGARNVRVDFQPGVRRAFGALSRRLVQCSKRRSNEADWMNGVLDRRTIHGFRLSYAYS